MRRPAIFALALCLLLALAGAPASASPNRPPEPDVIGGEPAPPGAWPWLVALVNTRSGSVASGWYCGGTLIAPEWVLTAAHCAYDLRGAGTGPALPGDIDVVLGRERLASSDGERVRLREVHTHPLYGFAALEDSDIALLRLEAPSSRPTVRLAAPGDAGLSAPGTVARVAGWGDTRNYGPSLYPGTIFQTTVPIMAGAACAPAYDYPDNPNSITPAMLCAGLPEGGRDTCFGDSGGPLMVGDRAGGAVQAGITSFGTGCAIAGFPGVYTRVDAFAGWIAATIGGAPHLSVGLSGPGIAAPGEPITYRLRAANSGATPLSGLVLSNTLPLGASPIAASDGGTLAGGVATWAIGNMLPPGAVVERTLTVSATASIENAGYAASAPGAQATGLVPLRTAIDVPRLFLTPNSFDNAARNALSGSVYTYTLSLYNGGKGPNATASDIVISHTLPVSLTYAGSSDSGARDGRVVRWAVPQLAPDESLQRSVQAYASRPGYVIVSGFEARAAGGVRASALDYIETLVRQGPYRMYLTLAGK
jgi:uncharacterized repeat protein (TIGR01451 family)